MIRGCFHEQLSATVRLRNENIPSSLVRKSVLIRYFRLDSASTQFLTHSSCLASVSDCLLFIRCSLLSGKFVFDCVQWLQWQPCEREIGGKIVKLPRKPGEIENYREIKMQLRQKFQCSLGLFAVRRTIFHTKILAALNCTGRLKMNESLAKKSWEWIHLIDPPFFR